MEAKNVEKKFSKVKKIAGYVSTIATIGVLITRFFKKKEKQRK